MSPYQQPTTRSDLIRSILRKKKRIMQKELVLTIGGAHSQTRFILAKMEFDGEIRRLKIGRDNIIERVCKIGKIPKNRRYS